LAGQELLAFLKPEIRCVLARAHRNSTCCVRTNWIHIPLYVLQWGVSLCRTIQILARIMIALRHEV